jgi:hypothetical protein
MTYTYRVVYPDKTTKDFLVEENHGMEQIRQKFNEITGLDWDDTNAQKIADLKYKCEFIGPNEN